MARESSLWSWLSKARLQLGAALHINRVENSVMAGMPDVEGYLVDVETGQQGQFWLELKSTKRPFRASTPIRFAFRNREAQITWLDRRWAMGANAFFLLQVGSGSQRSLFLAPGSIGHALKRGMTEAELAVECCNSGYFKQTVSQRHILVRAITCRRFPRIAV